ncbi:MAG: DUF4143 domain-containing protein [Bacilli bacterium]
MERKIMTFLQKWQKDILRKPLILYGPKQVGKTYSAICFGKTHYKTTVYFNACNNKRLDLIFDKETAVDKIIMRLELLSGETIFKKDTLIIIDNVNSPSLVKALRSFGSEKCDYHIIIITSLRDNLNLFKSENFQYKGMVAMDFEEYLLSIDKREILEYIKESYITSKVMPYHSLAMDLFHDYLMTGGFPEAVFARINNEDETLINNIVQKIYDTYQKEIISIHNLIDIVRSVEVLNSIPYQLIRSSKKFQYGLIAPGKRSKDYENCIDFLVNNQMVYRSYRVSSIKSPLSSCREKDSFKLYYNDCGLLYFMLHTSKREFFMDSKIKNALYENYVAKCLMEAGFSLYYYQSEGKAYLKFVVQNRLGKIIPIDICTDDEIKSKSLSIFMSKYEDTEAIRFTEDNFKTRREIRYIPIYAAFCLNENR